MATSISYLAQERGNRDKENFSACIQSPSTLTPKAKKRVSFDLGSAGGQQGRASTLSQWPPQTPQKQQISSSPFASSSSSWTQKSSPRFGRSTSSSLPEVVPAYAPLPIVNSQWRRPTPLEARATRFLVSPRFLQMCAISIQLANCLPTSPPPLEFVSVDVTPMHPWYASLATTFQECFARRLRAANIYPKHAAQYHASDGTITAEEDHVAFTRELAEHIVSIFRGFHSQWGGALPHPPSNTTTLTPIPLLPPLATLALHDTLSPANHPPKSGWHTGEPLHHSYVNILHRFEAGVVRLLADDDLTAVTENNNNNHHHHHHHQNTGAGGAWILAYPVQLQRGIAGYQQFFIRMLRREWEVRDAAVAAQKQQQQQQRAFAMRGGGGGGGGATAMMNDDGSFNEEEEEEEKFMIVGAARTLNGHGNGNDGDENEMLVWDWRGGGGGGGSKIPG